MIKHVKYNYRFNSDGNALYDYFTVGEEAEYPISVTDTIKFTVDVIDVYEDRTAIIAATSKQGDYSISISGVSSYLSFTPTKLD